MVGAILENYKDKLVGKKVFLRLDLNVPQDAQGNITDDSRIVATLDTLNLLIKAGARTIIASHLKRPDGEVVESMRLDPVARRLSELLAKPVIKLDEAIGPKVDAEIAKLKDGDVCMLENIRFYPGEETKVEVERQEFAKQLAKNIDIYVNDAFGTAHRKHASTYDVALFVSKALPGLLMERELEMLGKKLNDKPIQPFIALIGGSKISSKIKVLEALLDKVVVLLIGGGMAFTFIKAQGGKIGKSICEDSELETARRILRIADEKGVALILPSDSVCISAAVDVFDKDMPADAQIETKVYPSNAIPDDMQGMDIGPESAEDFADQISKSRTILWNGPVGVFEKDSLANGTRACALALQKRTAEGGTTVIGGGDSVAAIEKFKIPKSAYSHVSTGGGASLEFLEGKVLPGVECLELGQAAAA